MKLILILLLCTLSYSKFKRNKKQVVFCDNLIHQQLKRQADATFQDSSREQSWSIQSDQLLHVHHSPIVMNHSIVNHSPVVFAPIPVLVAPSFYQKQMDLQNQHNFVLARSQFPVSQNDVTFNDQGLPRYGLHRRFKNKKIKNV